MSETTAESVDGKFCEYEYPTSLLSIYILVSEVWTIKVGITMNLHAK